MADQETIFIDWFDIPSYGMSFKFKFVKQDDEDIRIYILSQPAYSSGQATGGHETHRYGLLNDSPYICYEPMPQNMCDAKVIACEWAKRTAYYIKHNQWFQKGEFS